MIYLFLFVLVGSEENPGKEKEKGKGEEEILEEGKVDRIEEEREGNIVRRKQKKDYTTSTPNYTKYKLS